MNETELCDALEALLFAATAPMKKTALRAIAKRWLADEQPAVSETDEGRENDADAEAKASEPSAAAPPQTMSEGDDATHSEAAQEFALQPTAAEQNAQTRFEQAFARLCERWAARQGAGMRLCEVAEGYAFRTHPRFGPLLRKEREGRPGKLSKPALEALAIVAYRQPVTKPEIDELRGVDSGGGLKVLLERQLVEVQGKKDEPGRPLLYGTTAHFLDFFALRRLSELPSLREYEELHDEHLERVGALAPGELLALAQSAPALGGIDAQAGEALASAMAGLGEARAAAKEAFGAHGIALGDEDEPADVPPAPTVH